MKLLLLLEDDVFILNHNEVQRLINGDTEAVKYITNRKINFDKYRQYSMFPDLIFGRFIPDDLEKNDNIRRDFYSCFDDSSDISDTNTSIKGFSGASGIVKVINK